MRLLLASIVILIIACCSGCSQSSTPSNARSAREQSQPEGNVSLQQQFPRLKCNWIKADGKEIESTGSPINASDAGFSVVEEKFRQLDWSNSASKPSLAIEQTEDRSLIIKLSPDPTGNHDEMIAVVRRPGPNYGNATSTILRHSRPLKDAEQALSLLRAYTEEKVDFESLVEWVDQDADSSTKTR